MLILSMLLRITEWTQEELANYIGISRASINMWLKDDSGMSNKSKETIANLFQFPVSYFSIDLEQDLSLYKIVFSTLYESWKRIKKNNIKDEDKNTNKINQILNDIEADYIKENDYELTEIEMLESLALGCNPYTGELFDNNHILNNQRVKKLINKVKDNYKYISDNITKEELNDDEKKLFEKLRKWRRKKQDEENFYNTYIVFTDKELINIVLAEVNQINDLKKVKGIGEKKYQKYGKELFEIIKEHKKIANTYDNMFKEFGDIKDVENIFREFDNINDI